MRPIQKNREPVQLTQWRANNKSNVNYGYGLIDSNLRTVIKSALLCEQGYICAYTGQRINMESCHIEHPKPQTHCQPSKTVAYDNMLACYPGSNSSGADYGAHRKGSWPDPTQEQLFVSPLSPNCGARFSFKLNGEISPSDPNDAAASETIKRLALDQKN